MKKMFNKTDTATFEREWQEILARFPQVVADEMLKETEDAFKTKSWDNNPWTKNKFGKTPGLIKSGKMKKSIKVTTEKNSVTITADTDYASYQQNGTNKIPARPFIGDSDKLELFISEYLEKEITKKFK